MTSCPKPERKKRGFKRTTVIESVPLEDTEQYTVIDWLRAHKILHTANVPDRRNCHRMGYSKGVPDILIFDRPAMVQNGLVFVGAAIEMKRRKGGIVSPEQAQWLENLKELGWSCKVAYGADDAIQFLESNGYGVRSCK